MFRACHLKLKEKNNQNEKCFQMLYKEGCRKKCFNSSMLNQHSKNICTDLPLLRSPNNYIFCSKSRPIKVRPLFSHVCF